MNNTEAFLAEIIGNAEAEIFFARTLGVDLDCFVRVCLEMDLFADWDDLNEVTDEQFQQQILFGLNAALFMEQGTLIKSKIQGNTGKERTC